MKLEKIIKGVIIGLSGLIILNSAYSQEKKFKLKEEKEQVILFKEDGLSEESSFNWYSIEKGNLEDNKFDTVRTIVQFFHPPKDSSEDFEAGRCKDRWTVTYFDFEKEEYKRGCLNIKNMPENIREIIERLNNPDNLWIINWYLSNDNLELYFNPRLKEDKKYHEDTLRLLNSETI